MLNCKNPRVYCRKVLLYCRTRPDCWSQKLFCYIHGIILFIKHHIFMIMQRDPLDTCKCICTYIPRYSLNPIEETLPNLLGVPENPLLLNYYETYIYINIYNYVHLSYKIVTFAMCFPVGYTMEHIIYRWLPNPVEFDTNIQLPQFTLVNFTLKDCSQNYTTGKQ